MTFWHPFFVFMSNEEIKKIILDLAQPIVAGQGLVIWGLELTGAPPKNVRLFVDIPDADRTHEAASASIDQCEDISRQLGLALEVEDCMPASWTLEVSSPGLERSFFALPQMDNFKGDLVEATLTQSFSPAADVPGRAVWRGKLTNVGEADFTLEPCQISAEGEIMPEKLPAVTIPWNLRKKVRRLHVFPTPVKPGKSRNKKKQ